MGHKKESFSYSSRGKLGVFLIFLEIKLYFDDFGVLISKMNSIFPFFRKFKCPFFKIFSVATISQDIGSSLKCKSNGF